MAITLVLQSDGAYAITATGDANLEEVSQAVRAWEASGSHLVTGDASADIGFTEVLTRDLSSGRIHRRVIDPKAGYRMLVDERCQTDQSGRYEVLSSDDKYVDERNLYCEWCFLSGD